MDSQGGSGGGQAVLVLQEVKLGEGTVVRVRRGDGHRGPHGVGLEVSVTGGEIVRASKLIPFSSKPFRQVKTFKCALLCGFSTFFLFGVPFLTQAYFGF